VRRVLFSYFVRPNSFSAVPIATGPVLIFYTPELIFGGTEGRRVPFSCFALPDSFSTVPRSSGPVFMF
jgi:hypothetical protein